MHRSLWESDVTVVVDSSLKGWPTKSPAYNSPTICSRPLAVQAVTNSTPETTLAHSRFASPAQVSTCPGASMRRRPISLNAASSVPSTPPHTAVSRTAHSRHRLLIVIMTRILHVRTVQPVREYPYPGRPHYSTSAISL